MCKHFAIPKMSCIFRRKHVLLLLQKMHWASKSVNTLSIYAFANCEQNRTHIFIHPLYSFWTAHTNTQNTISNGIGFGNVRAGEFPVHAFNPIRVACMVHRICYENNTIRFWHNRTILTVDNNNPRTGIQYVGVNIGNTVCMSAPSNSSG